MHRPKVSSVFQEEESYPDIDEGFFLHEQFGRAMFRPKSWDSGLRTDLISYHKPTHEKALNSIKIGPTVTRLLRAKVISLVTTYWDVFDPAGIRKTILGYEFKIDTGTSKGICCRPPGYGHYEGSIIMKHIKVLLHNKWIVECNSGAYGAPIVLAPKPHQEDVENIDDFVWRMCVSYRALNKITRPFEYPIGRCDDAVEDLGDGAGRIYFITIDCAQGYHQIRIWGKDQENSIFRTR